MRILHLAYTDVSGVPSRWARAHRDAGHGTQLFLERPHDYQYPSHAVIERWSEDLVDPWEGADRLEGVLAWADAIMAYDHPFYLQVALATGKPVLFRALGTAARDHAKELRALLKHPLVARATTGTVDLADMLGIEHVGAPYRLLPRARASEAVLVHAPSNRLFKQTSLLLDAAAETGWHVEVLEDAHNERVLARKWRSHGVLDSGPGSVPDGYGVNSVEAMAMALPAVAGCSAGAERRLREVGCPVLCVQTYGELVAALERLRYPEERKLLGEAGRRFVFEFHSGEKRVREDNLALGELRVAA
jgi:hypothetical protein